ncbi:unnamed protein product [Coregonus sp. 'balchen']|nr:unnamed protein product [Coregonus sp. 'balchen']
MYGNAVLAQASLVLLSLGSLLKVVPVFRVLLQTPINLPRLLLPLTSFLRLLKRLDVFLLKHLTLVFPQPPLCEFLPPPPRKFQAGELSHFASIYEHGSSQSEPADQWFPPNLFLKRQALFQTLLKPEPSQEGFTAKYDELFVTGAFPADTTDHEHGNDQWRSANLVQYLPLFTVSDQQVQEEMPQPKGPVPNTEEPEPGDIQDQGEVEPSSTKGQVRSKQFQGGSDPLTIEMTPFQDEQNK